MGKGWGRGGVLGVMEEGGVNEGIQGHRMMG